MKFIPYLSFEGNAEEALEFYANAFNGTMKTIHQFLKHMATRYCMQL